MRVLGIETSCDETAAAVVEANPGSSRAPTGPGRILANVISGQFEAHAAFGGVVPEIAARSHVEKLDGTIAEAMGRANLSFDELDGIAVTAGPGLIGGVLVGVMTAKALSMASGVPFVGVNHLEGHALTARLTDGVEFPFLLMLVSGGHTQLVHVEGLGRYRRLGTTIDDAAGEAFDKTAKLLGLPQPGGPSVQGAAVDGDPRRFAFPRPLMDRGGYDFSFAGLKTAVRQTARSIAPVTDQDISDICASFQAAVADVLGQRLRDALRDPALTDTRRVVAAGGVAANTSIRHRLAREAEVADAHLILPPIRFCTDNGAMIAWAGIERLASGERSELNLPARARWPLDHEAAPRVGGGKRGARA